MRQFKPTSDMIQAAKAVFMAMAFRDTIKPIVEEYERGILQRHQWHIAREWVDQGMEDRVILDPKDSYLLEESDFLVYLRETFEARDRAGLRVDKPEHCPLLVAETLLVQAEWALIDTMKPVTGFDGQLYGEHRAKFLDLTLRLLAPFIAHDYQI